MRLTILVQCAVSQPKALQSNQVAENVQQADLDTLLNSTTPPSPSPALCIQKNSAPLPSHTPPPPSPPLPASQLTMSHHPCHHHHHHHHLPPPPQQQQHRRPPGRRLVTRWRLWTSCLTQHRGQRPVAVVRGARRASLRRTLHGGSPALQVGALGVSQGFVFLTCVWQASDMITRVARSRWTWVDGVARKGGAPSQERRG